MIIDGEKFTPIRHEIQLSVDNSATIHLSLDLMDQKKFTDIYDSRRTFDIISRRFRAKDCRIKILDISKLSINLSITCYDFHEIDNSEIRDNVINEVLGTKQN